MKRKAFFLVVILLAGLLLSCHDQGNTDGAATSQSSASTAAEQDGSRTAEKTTTAVTERTGTVSSGKAGSDATGQTSGDAIKGQKAVAPIIYEKADVQMKRGGSVQIAVEKHQTTGKTLEARLVCAQFSAGYVYYLIDWGDGTWSYNGPFTYNATGFVRHAYRKAGAYEVCACAVNIDTGERSAWSKGYTVSVSGEDKAADPLSPVKAISSSTAGVSFSATNILDGDNRTVWRSKTVDSETAAEYAGLLFDKHYALDLAEIKFSGSCETVPENISVQYTTDGGKIWYDLPTYYYVMPYMTGRYTAKMNFINPKGATLSLDLNGIVANGIRIISKKFGGSGKQYFEIAEMRAEGSAETLFYSSRGGTFDADINNMWSIYGTAQTEPAVSGNIAGPNPDPFRSGCATITSQEWMEWDGKKLLWTGYTKGTELWKSTLFSTYVGPDDWGNSTGFVWATANSMKHLGVQNHYANNPIFILAARHYLLMNVSQTPAFFDSVNSRNQKMYDRLDAAMDYMLEALDGRSGVLTIRDPKNDGTYTGDASNYWDAYRAFGYRSCYENILFYASLNAMADIEQIRGDSGREKEYRSLAAVARTEINRIFWDSSKGRYITSVDKTGRKHDYGMTFLNFMAVAYGLAPEQNAKQIYDWIDGRRIIAGDTSKGADIYAFIYNARSNTLDVSATGKPYYWWDHDGQLPCTPNTFGGFGNQIQNGGTIFYSAHYDMTGRLLSMGAADAYNRFTTIMKEFHKDELRRWRFTEFGGYVEGIIGEFPESGLVPLTFLTGFIGVDPEPEGLAVRPMLPGELSFAGVRKYVYNGKTYSIEVNKRITRPSLKKNGSGYLVKLPAAGQWIISRDGQILKKEPG